MEAQSKLVSGDIKILKLLGSELEDGYWEVRNFYVWNHRPPISVGFLRVIVEHVTTGGVPGGAIWTCDVLCGKLHPENLKFYKSRNLLSEWIVAFSWQWWLWSQILPGLVIRNFGCISKIGGLESHCPMQLAMWGCPPFYSGMCPITFKWNEFHKSSGKNRGKNFDVRSVWANQPKNFARNMTLQRATSAFAEKPNPNAPQE